MPVAALSQEAPDAVEKRIADEVLGVIRSDKDVASGNPQKVVALAEQKVLPHFDFTRKTRLAVGRNWSQASDAQKEALTKEFRTMLVRTYSSSLSAVANFFFIPYYHFWAIVLIALDVWVIWSLTRPSAIQT